MKTRFFILICFAIFFCSCDTPETIDSQRYKFCIFRLKNEMYKELIITGNANVSEGYFRTINGINNFPKRYKEEPYFGSARWSQAPEKYTFDICELATEEKLLALHDGYYIYFPYTGLSGDGSSIVVRDGKWDTICSCNPLELSALGESNSIYSEIRLFEIKPLEKITKKSRKEMTIEDIEKAINKVIDDGKLDQYTITTTTIWDSKE